MRYNLTNKSPENWSYDLFVEHPHLYLPILESMKDQGSREVEALCKKFSSLGIPKGSKILDMSCGIGRHAINLAKNGYEVVGYDPSSFFLSKALKWADKEFLSREKIRFYNGPVERVSTILGAKKEHDFKVIILLFTSIGYGSLEDDVRVFRMLRKIGCPDCTLITETENRDWRLANFQPNVLYQLGKTVIQETWKFDPKTSVATSISMFYERLRNRDLRLRLKLNMRMRLYSLHEIISLLNSSRWKFMKSYDGFFSPNEASTDSETIITVSTKNGD